MGYSNPAWLHPHVAGLYRQGYALVRGGEHLLFLFPGCQPWARGAKDVEVGQNGAAHTVALGARGAAGELGAELPQEQGAVLGCHQSRVK